MIQFSEVKIVKSTNLVGDSKEIVVHGLTDTDTFEFILFRDKATSEWLLDELAYIYYRNDQSNAFQIFIQPNQFPEYQQYLAHHPNVKGHN
ncbi:hypothetical protein [Bacillus pinisoli]|uniref:hypothetical protein n=1 Tax=Bacillus pinisoli TaxID=2901866 RepID=UPI001FF0EFB5|nr:hypothetical protein [Bacillus pinisoli]